MMTVVLSADTVTVVLGNRHSDGGVEQQTQ